VTISVDDNLVIDVTDDGIGIAKSAPHSGLRNLQQRATDTGGTFTADQPENGGTHLAWVAPLP
ncbi:MAG TPA: histidine kinase, partial [Pseudonocardiaceae bacterium]